MYPEMRSRQSGTAPSGMLDENGTGRLRPGSIFLHPPLPSPPLFTNTSNYVLCHLSGSPLTGSPRAPILPPPPVTFPSRCRCRAYRFSLPTHSHFQSSFSPFRPPQSDLSPSSILLRPLHPRRKTRYFIPHPAPPFSCIQLIQIIISYLTTDFSFVISFTNLAAINLISYTILCMYSS